MPQLVDILLFTVLSHSTQSLAVGRKHRAALFGRWKTFDVIIQKVLLNAMVLSGRFYWRCCCRPSSSTCPRLRNRRQRPFGFSPSARQRSTVARPNLEWPGIYLFIIWMLHFPLLNSSSFHIIRFFIFSFFKSASQNQNQHVNWRQCSCADPFVPEWSFFVTAVVDSRLYSRIFTFILHSGCAVLNEWALMRMRETLLKCINKASTQ